ncbi:MAG: imidazoleglycerol-phosphate dehydratase HisB [Clostridia bacterium]|nr:imidazoleglycerol-phosphate dehydratase HisB [Clostridia bacterium]
MRESRIERKTGETEIKLSLSLDGSGRYSLASGVGFLNHMLALFAKHGSFDLTLSCKGDLEVDCHHSAEDIGICLGEALKEALGDKVGIRRYGDRILPMDEALILVAIDLSGRGYLGYEVELPSARVGEFDTELVEEFLAAFSRSAGITLHVRQLAGRNTHHIIEGIFKCLARALRDAVEIDPRNSGALPSTKGVLK